MKTLVLLLALCSSVFADVTAHIDLKESDTISVLAQNIELSHDISVTSIGVDAKEGYVVATKLLYIGLRNYLYLKGSEATLPEKAKLHGLTLVEIINFKPSARLDAEISGYNLKMITAQWEQ